MGTFTWPPARTSSWPPVGTFSWPRTRGPHVDTCWQRADHPRRPGAVRIGLGGYAPRLRRLLATRLRAVARRTRAGARAQDPPGRTTGGSAGVSIADDEVSAVTELWIGDHAEAANRARDAATKLQAAGEAEHAAFWRYVEAHAHFDRGRPQDLAAAREALEDATSNGPRTTWFRRLLRTVADLEGTERTADDTDRFFLARDEWRREAGARLDRALSEGRALLTGSHDQQCEGLKVLARLVGAGGERPPKSEQSATDCRSTWSTAKRAERRVWDVKTVPAGAAHPRRCKPTARADRSRDQALCEDPGLRLSPHPSNDRKQRRRRGSTRQGRSAQAPSGLAALRPVGRQTAAGRRPERRRQRDSTRQSSDHSRTPPTRGRLARQAPGPTHGRLLTADDVAAIFPST
jgi:hypothetical protein